MLKKAFYSFIKFFISIPIWGFYILLLISLLAIEYYNFNLSPDISAQLNTLVNFANGHGITLSSLNENNQVVYTLSSHWPAGLVIFILPFFLITKSTTGAVLILNGICYVLYILFLKKFLNYLSINSIRQKFIISFLIVSIAPFVYFYPSDTLATVICLWGFYYNLKFLDSKKNYHLIISVFLLGVSYFVRYSFLPFIFYPLVSFLLKEKGEVKKRIKGVLFLFSICVLSTLLFYFINKALVGPNHVDFATGLDLFNGNAHWNQLSHFNGFLFTFGIYEWVLSNFFKDHLDILIRFNFISLAVTFYFYIIFVKLFFIKSLNYNKQFYNSLSISLSAGNLIIFFLAFLTLNNAGQTWTSPYWTYVQETRYYAPVIIIGLINILVIFLTEKKGILIHTLVPLMLLFNLYGYRTLIQSGFWGSNYEKYSKDKSKIYERVQIQPGKNSIFYSTVEMKNTIPYLIIQSQGDILGIKNSSADIDCSPNYNCFFLQIDSVNSFKVNAIHN